MEIPVNRVAQSEIIVFDLASVLDARPVLELDLMPFLFKGLVLREKDFRAHVAALDPEPYRDAHVGLFCSTDAIVPTWAWMLLTAHLHPVAASVTVGRAADVSREQCRTSLNAVPWEDFQDRIVVVKGCGGSVPPYAYAQAMHHLMHVARKLMYGEPCSSVPLWRRPKAQA